MINIHKIKGKILAVVYIAIILVFATGAHQSAPPYVGVFAMPATGTVIVIDAGHGGWDSYK